MVECTHWKSSKKVFSIKPFKHHSNIAHLIADKSWLVLDEGLSLFYNETQTILGYKENCAINIGYHNYGHI